jgi:hypothetical protein
MMKTVAIHYGVTFGKGDSSDWIDYEIELTDEEAAIYDDAIAKEILLEDVPELQKALERVYPEIEEIAIENGLEFGDEYTEKCQGVAEMDPDELNDLVAERDPHTLEFFGLTDADDDELDEWDANDLDELPLVKDFVEGFEPYSPFDEGYILSIEYVDPNY